ncbi:MAG: SDR family NAD(P)-dependent oxidoreductase [Desulfobacterales bacterium]
MKTFEDKIAVVTGAGTGMGRELACQLASEGCHVAFCEVIVENMVETERLCREIALPGTRITAHECDVSDEAQVIAFRDAVKKQHDTTHINLLFNNAGVGGGGSFILDDRTEWDKTFAVDWSGVYYNTRAFMPMLIAGTEGHIINTSSVNGFWACLGNDVAHTSYSSAKFAVKGFTEALQIDLRLNAPHVKAYLVMPGHIGTSIGINSRKIHGGPEADDLTAEDLAAMRERMVGGGMATEDTTDDQLREMVRHLGEDFRDNAPCSSAQAATIILDGVRNGQWRILVGEDAKMLDQMVRTHAETVYDATFMETLQGTGELGALFSEKGPDDPRE